MQELTITSGRHMHHIDPHLTIWGWEIPVYLFLGGLVAGILFFSAVYFLRGKSDEMRTTVRVAPLFVPFLLATGLFALFLDLEYKIHLFRFYTVIRLQSPMSWGSWTLGIIFPLSTLWALMHAESVFPNWRYPYKWMEQAMNFVKKYAKILAWLLIYYAAILGIYTGILLSAFNARPIWNTAILGPLFLVSGFSTALAFNMILSKTKEERHKLGKIDLMAIGTELFLIIHMFMGFLASTEIHVEAAQLFLGGPYTAPFWIFVVGVGLLIPALIEVLDGMHKVKSTLVPAFLVLFGGLMLRFIIVDAGQFSSWIF
ncbi:MAG: polysulfide reductase NrfD [Deferribacteres bacterium]|nr:polysulfide reductase NrfD [candidate division KSB1 bacterium]MCB9503807.1 polysulfide reductase NrfD [Deferribacteres bacterium]